MAHLDLVTLANRHGHRVVRVHRSPLTWSPLGQFDRDAGDRISADADGMEVRRMSGARRLFWGSP